MRNFILPLSTKIWTMPPRLVKVSESLNRQNRRIPQGRHNLRDTRFRDAGEIEQVARRNRFVRRDGCDRDGSPRELLAFDRLRERICHGAVPEYARRHRGIGLQRVGWPFGEPGKVEQERPFQRDLGDVLCLHSPG
jgi:hypothetical protein